MKRQIGGIGAIAFKLTQFVRNNQVSAAAGYLAGLGAAPANIPVYIDVIRRTCVDTLQFPRKVTIKSIPGFEDFDKDSFTLYPKEQ
jgi:hypothetical protein